LASLGTSSSLYGLPSNCAALIPSSSALLQRIDTRQR
jgi:hypothetical protein